MLFRDGSMGVQVEEGSKPSLVQGNGRAVEGVWTLDREPNRLTVHDKGLFFFGGGFIAVAVVPAGQVAVPPAPGSSQSVYQQSRPTMYYIPLEVGYQVCKIDHLTR